jgi:predicted signal transduction protein with EAL and GGDEF domain
VQRHRDGSTIEVEGRWTLVRGDDGQPQSILAINTDIRQRKASEREIQRLAFYDPLTGLPNRMLLMDRMHHALARPAPPAGRGAAVHRPGQLQTLNDTLGHDQGDLLLQQVAQRLNTACAAWTPWRAWAATSSWSCSKNSAQAQSWRCRRAAWAKDPAMLAMPYPLQGYQYRSTPSIGIAPFTGEHTTVASCSSRPTWPCTRPKTAGATPCASLTHRCRPR